MHVLIDTLLVRTPDICGGRLRLDGTRITVNQLVVCYKEGLSAEDITGQYPHLSLAQVYTALAFYHANKVEVETELRQEREETVRLANLYAKSALHQ